jgi:hypothetical protein
MKLSFPSKEFDDVVAAVCCGEASEVEMRALNELLRTHAAARDEYILRVEIHSRLASEPEIFLSDTPDEAPIFCETCAAPQKAVIPFPPPRRAKTRKLVYFLALAACLAVLAAGIWKLQFQHPAAPKVASYKAVAILNRTVDAQWNQAEEIPQVGTLLSPGRWELRAGLAQFVFYSGARVVIEGPAQIELTSPNEIFCSTGRIMAEVPSPAGTFRIRTPHAEASAQATSIGLDVRELSTELQVFKGSVLVSPVGRGTKQNVQEGTGAVAEKSHRIRLIPGNSAAFASLFDLQSKSLDAEARRYTQWHAASGRLNHDPSLIVHIDFDELANYSQERLRNSAGHGPATFDTIVGCQTVSGRWAEKEGVEFQNVGDRVRLTVPGEFNALTLSAWVRVQGLDRRFSSLFMCDGFELGEIHWMVVNNGALALTVKGSNRGNFQAAQSPPVLSQDRFGTWVQLAVVIDGNTKRVTHYLNGRAVSEQAVSLNSPLHISGAELGNWNADEFPIDDHDVWIRNFNGAMDEFCMFSRALNDAEILDLYLAGKPESGY